jgi:hypothetical protein
VSARSRLDAVHTVTPRYFAPKEVATPDKVRALLASDDLDPVTREHLQAQLDAMETPARDAFARVVQANYAAEEAF